MVTATDAERPLYLPGGRMVWAQRTAAGFQMQSGEDGRPTPNFLNPTAGPGDIAAHVYAGTNAFPADVLRDGRILFEAGFPLGSGTTPELYLVYADGSGVSRCAAIMGARAGAERNWHRGTWSLRTERRWLASPRRWRMKCRFKRRAAIRRRDCRDRLRCMADERANGDRSEDMRSRCGRPARGDANRFGDERRRSGRARAGRAAHAAQSASIGPAPMGLREPDGVGRARQPRRRFEREARVGAPGGAGRRGPRQLRWERRRSSRTDRSS
jgi:hypothetical protein